MKKVLPLALLLVAASLFTSFVQAQTVVCVETNLDTFCMELKETDAPLATANFLAYVANGTYTNTAIHLSVRHGYIQGGSWAATVVPTPVVAGVPITNEFKLPNTAGTVALVTTPGNPDSATTGWRINVADNSSSFSKANSGAVFAQIIDDASMAVVRRLSGLTVHNIDNGHLQQAPLLHLDNLITDDDLVIVKRMYVYDGGKAAYLANGLPNVIKPVIADAVCLAFNILGELCMKMDPDDAPKTVANFLSYVNSGRYNNTVLHRSVSSFVMQGGGYKYVNGAFTPIATDAAVVNEYKRSNLGGTVAMAKLDGSPDSATSQFFFNMIDNVALNTTNGGFTVFAEVIPHSLRMLSDLASIPAFDFDPTVTGDPNDSTPVLDTYAKLSADDLITIDKAYVAQRDVSASASPVINVVTMATFGPLYGMIAARFPVYIGNKFYMMVLKRYTYTDAEIASGLNKDGIVRMIVDQRHIVELLPNFRVSATFDGQLLTIPSVRLEEQVFINVQLKLIDSKNLVFQLLPGFEQL